MSQIYFVRHGQAGTRENYDQLSELGYMQSKLLGRYFAEQGLEFDRILSGSMDRQRQTAETVCSNLNSTVPDAVQFVVDEGWNEFILATVYKGLAPRLSVDSKSFAGDYEEMRRALEIDPHTTRGAAGRCDRAVIEAWMENRYPDYEGESWTGFSSRVRKGFDQLSGNLQASRTCIFTSATPIAICVGLALSLSNREILKLMAVLRNSSITTIKLRENEPLLISFNSTPHLDDPALVTFR